MEMKAGDLFLFSSKTIPGNERDVLKIVNAFSEMGVDVVDDAGGLYHVSGHANRPDLEHVHRLLLPDMLIPMHGEHRHLREHARIAREAGIVADVVTNGTMVDLTGEAPRVVDRIGTALVGQLDGVIRDRIRMALNGHVMVTVILDDENDTLGDAWVELSGLTDKGRTGSLSEVLETDLNDFLSGAPAKVIADDDKLDEALRRVVRQTAMEEIGKKPEVTVVISRLMSE
jgi:ribonuclease J